MLPKTRQVVETTVLRISLILFTSLLQVRCQTLVEQDFSPTVTATCKAGVMTIRVATGQPFYGVIHSRDGRKNGCMRYGDGSSNITLDVNLLASPESNSYCGVISNNKSEERSVPIAVRIHKTLELADDKFYVITCGKAGFKNARNETSLVSMKLLTSDGKKVHEVVQGRLYNLRVDVSRPDGSYGIRVRSCFSFSGQNSTVQLVNEKGCPEKGILSPFKYEPKSGVADATLYSMFKFPNSNKVHFQCDVAICKGGCPPMTCDDMGEPLPTAQARSLNTRDGPQDGEEGVLMASTTVFVVEPGEGPVVMEALCEGLYPNWLLWLCIALGVLFLIMLIINIFLCTALTCSCTKTEVVEKEPSVIEDYDPYRSWHGSQYGSRYSLNGKPGYTSGGSTMNSTRSVSSHSDHYAIVHSRPGSRYSAPGSHKGAHRGGGGGPGSANGSHYSSKI